jgi:N-acetylmuramoyl-L-alanine amidase
MRKREITVILATAVILVTCGVLLRDPALIKLADQAGTTAGSKEAGTAKGDVDGNATTDDWEGTGLTATALDPSVFAQGACMEFTPGSGPTRDQTVFIDAGHGGVDPGGNGTTSSGGTVIESAVNLSVGLDAMKLLTSAGYRVILDRTQETTVVKLTPADTGSEGLSDTGVVADLAARDQCANLGKANLLIGVYQNAGAEGEAGSVTVYDAARPFASDNERFANILQTDVLNVLNAQGYQIPNGGVSTDVGYGSTDDDSSASYGHLELLGPSYPAGGFTTPSNMPGALIEPLFLSDPFEATIAASAKGQELMAEGLADAAEQYFATEPAPAPGKATTAKAKAS